MSLVDEILDEVMSDRSFDCIEYDNQIYSFVDGLYEPLRSKFESFRRYVLKHGSGGAIDLIEKIDSNEDIEGCDPSSIHSLRALEVEMMFSEEGRSE